MWIRSFVLGVLPALIAITAVQAEPSDLKTFNSGSYAQLLQAHAGHPFVLAIWSLDCPSCIKDMKVIADMRVRHPELKFVMLSTDEPSVTPEVQTMLTRTGLNALENWIFGSDDAQKLRYEIDANWFGELPRTYFYDATHTRTGYSGALSNADFESQIGKIMH